MKVARTVWTYTKSERIVRDGDLTAYNEALVAVVEDDYTATSWIGYQIVVTANEVTTDNTQDEIDAATSAITAAQANLIKKDAVVNNEDELRIALGNNEITKITLEADIEEISRTLKVNNKVTIDGDNYKLTFTSELNDLANGERQGLLVTAVGAVIKNLTVEMDANEATSNWQGVFGIQAFNTTGVVIEDVTLTGGDAGLLVNLAEVTLNGTIDVSGNEFGGIEVSNDGELVITGVTLKNEDEASETPTIWEDEIEVDSNEKVTGHSLKVETYQKTEDNLQRFYYLNTELEVPTP